jgi:hypothetical protein
VTTVGKITKKATIQITSRITVGELQGLLAQVPSQATMRVQHYAGDQRDPSYTNLTFSWTD